MLTDNDQNNSTEGRNIETCHAHSPSIQKLVVTAPGINIQIKKERQAGSLSSPAFANTIATSNEVKREATDQGMLTFLLKLFPLDYL